MFSMIMGMSNRIDMHERLEKLKMELQPADKTGDKECLKCGYCCHMRPPIPSADEIEGLAEFHAITPQEFIAEYCTIDTQDNETYYPKIAGINSIKNSGSFLSDDDSWDEGRCIFLLMNGFHNNLCQLHDTDVKPASCKMAKCWEKIDLTEHDEVLQSWEDDTLKKRFNYEWRE